MAQKINRLQSNKGYSTTEQLTGDTWIDGKPIYRKVINFGALPNNTSKDVAHGITGADYFTDIRGVAVSGSIFIPINFANPLSLTAGIGAVVDGSNVQIITGINRTGYSAYVILEYTKT